MTKRKECLTKTNASKQTNTKRKQTVGVDIYFAGYVGYRLSLHLPILLKGPKELECTYMVVYLSY